MIENWPFWRVCGDKWPFEHRRDARHLAKQHRRVLKERIKPYRCAYCHQFHVGHPGRRPEDARQPMQPVS